MARYAMVADVGPGAVLRLGRGGAQAPKCWPGPPNIFVPTAKIRIVKI